VIIRSAKNVLFAILVFIAPACQPAIEADYAIVNGQVFIGNNSPSQNLVVAIKGDAIVYVGQPSKQISALHSIDAKDLYVLPGFIDPHTHSLSELKSDDIHERANKNYQFQGVTTVVNGNDGYGDPDIQSEIQILAGDGIGTNTALFIGHGALRKSVMGNDKRPPSESEMKAMKDKMHDGMQAGALGLSTGLFYAPGSFSETSEVIELARVAVEYGGIYDSHIRDEATYNIGLEAAIDEVVEIARAVDIHANIAHIKALGVDVWGKSEVIIKNVEDAHKEGLRITAIPRWVKAGTNNEYMARLKDPALLSKIKMETAENLRKRGGAQAVLITQDKFDWQGKTLEDIANQNALSPVDMAIEIALKGDARIASFNMNMDDITAFMKQPWVMTSSDGSTGHPRKYASFPKKYRDYVIGKNIMPVETFFYRSSGMVADTFGICDRGYLRDGYKADIAIIDPNTFAPIADFQNAEELSDGVRYLFVNGQPVIEDHQSKPDLPGVVIRRCERKKEQSDVK